MQAVPVEGMPFDEAMEVRTLKQPEAPWKLQMRSRIPTAFKKGDVLWISVWMRATESSSESRAGLSQLTMELATPRATTSQSLKWMPARAGSNLHGR